MSYGSSEGGGFNQASLTFKENPSLETYLEIRASNPAAELEFSFLGGLDAMFAMEDELEKYGFRAEEIVGVLDANPEAIDNLALELMRRICAARSLAQDGETHLVSRGLATPDKLIDWLISLCLNGMSWTDEMLMPRSLALLICDRLGAMGSSYRKSTEAHHQKKRATWIAASLRAQGHEYSIRRIAEIMGFAPSTLSRWFSTEDYESEVERLANLFDETGTLKPLR